MGRYFFKKSRRLRTNEQFRGILARKCCVSNDLVRLYMAENAGSEPRFGISVGKSCGGAVRRNRLKRLGREVFRQEQHNIPAEYDYLLIFTPKVSKKAKSADGTGAESVTFEYLRESFLRLADRGARKAEGQR